MAMDLGAADAKIATTDTILIDERLRAKCFVPACSSLGKNAHCPPHALDLDFMCRVVKNFRYVLFYMLKIPSEELVGPGFKEKKPGRRSATLN
jgi:predicted metal-binding protein